MGLVLIVAAYFGPSAYRKAEMDKEVDRLCSVDGGIKVFERISLPPDQFNQWGDPNIPFAGEKGTATSPYIIEIELRDLVRVDSSVLRRLTLVRFQARALRRVDGEILGEAVGYSRLGGDPEGPWHPSSYSGCAKSDDKNLVKNVFVRKG
jgi:hypothetical protein